MFGDCGQDATVNGWLLEYIYWCNGREDYHVLGEPVACPGNEGH